MALAELGVEAPRPLMLRLFTAAERGLKDLPPHHLPRLLWAYKGLRPQPPAALTLQLRAKVRALRAACVRLLAPCRHL